MTVQRTLAWAAAAVLLLATGSVTANYAVTDFVDAARRNDFHAVHKLLETDAEAVNATDADGHTALHWAAIRGHWRIVTELVAAKAPVNATGADGGTPLHWACHHDRADMITLLLDAGADLDVHNRWGRTPLHVAVRRGCASVAALLLDRGADVNVTTREGWTPLHVAYLSGHPELVRLLLERGADPDVNDEEGHRPADDARTRPEAVAVEPGVLAQYAGIYDLGGGFSFKVWLEDGSLRIREFAPDELYPIAADTFFCRQEPWQVRFHRDDANAVTEIEVRFLRRTVRGTRTATPQYVGSRACMACHISAETGNQYVSWLRSRHAHAYWRLASDWSVFLAHVRPQYKDMDAPMQEHRCLLCHVTGSQDPDNLFADSFRKEEGIGCESCHGPGSQYMDPEVMADRDRFLAAGGRIPDETTCRGCHRNAERFDFAEWWPKIAHPRPEGGAGESGTTH